MISQLPAPGTCCYLPLLNLTSRVIGQDKLIFFSISHFWFGILPQQQKELRHWVSHVVSICHLLMNHLAGPDSSVATSYAQEQISYPVWTSFLSAFGASLPTSLAVLSIQMGNLEIVRGPWPVEKESQWRNSPLYCLLS